MGSSTLEKVRTQKIGRKVVFRFSTPDEKGPVFSPNANSCIFGNLWFSFLSLLEYTLVAELTRFPEFYIFHRFTGQLEPEQGPFLVQNCEENELFQDELENCPYFQVHRTYQPSWNPSVNSLTVLD